MASTSSALPAAPPRRRLPRDKPSTSAISAQVQQDLATEGIENYELPKALVTKIARSAIPDNYKLQKEAVLSLVKSSTVFINYLSATAHGVALSKQHKSISASDVLKALEIIDLQGNGTDFQMELNRYREIVKSDKRKAARAKPKDPADSTKDKAKAKQPSESASFPAGEPMEHNDQDEAVVEDQDEEEDVEEEDIEDEEQEPLEDRVALEEAQLSRDTIGVEERDQLLHIM